MLDDGFIPGRSINKAFLWFIGDLIWLYIRCPRIKFTSCIQYYKEYKEQKHNIDIYVYGCVTTFLRDVDQFPYLIFFFLHNILFRAVFLFTGRKRITFYCWHFKNCCQNNKNEKLYFAFESVMKIGKSYLIQKPVTTRKRMIFTHWKFGLIIYTHKMGIWITQYLVKMNIDLLYE